MIQVNPKTKPKWYQWRKQLSRLLVFLLHKLGDKEYRACYLLEQMIKDSMLYGNSAVKIEPIPYEEIYKEINNLEGEKEGMGDTGI